MSSTPLTLDRVLTHCRPLIDFGAALHWLIPGQKRPAVKDWSSVPVHTLESLRSAHMANANIGIRLGEPSKTAAGYIHLIDLDIRDASQASAAHAKLAELLPNYNTFPTVISGSGGESRHYYFVTDRPFRKTKLAKSTTHKMVFDKRLNRDVKKNDWEIDLLGTGAQAVIPPSLHPDTGLAYRWAREFDFGMLDLGIGPVVDADLIADLGAAGSDETDMFAEDDDDLLSEWRSAALNLTDEEVDGIVADLSEEWVEDRDTWYQVGMALHHHYAGAEIGFEKWCEWSQQSEKYDPRTQKSVWKSFKGDRRPVTMRTLIKEANDVRLHRSLPEIEVAPVVAEKSAEFDDLEALLGGSTAVSAPIDDDLAALLGTSSLPDPKSDDDGDDSDENWTSLLDRNEEGHPKSVLHNVKLIVKNDIRTKGILALNEFSQDIVLIAPPAKVAKRRDSAKPVVNLEGELWKASDRVNGDLWTDSHDHAVRAVIEAPKTQGGYGLKVTDRDLKASVDGVANMQRFHPVRAYLENCVKHHDGKRGRCEGLFINYLGAEANDYHREAAVNTLVGAVARVYEPGHKFDFVPILEGLQGKRKSTFIRIMGRDWFTELTGDFHKTQEMVENIQGAWIIEIPELQGFSRADTNVLKGFLSRTVDRTRLSYDKRARNFKRQCIFFGSTNDEEYLRDHTGGRRFWPIKCQLEGEIDTVRLEAEIDQIWAEAVLIYREMRAKCKLKDLPLFIQSEGAVIEAKSLQESRRVDTAEDVLASRIEAWANEPLGAADEDDELNPNAPQKVRNSISTLQVWVEMEKHDASKFGPAEQSRYGRAMGRVVGFKKLPARAMTKKYGRQWVYVREGVTVAPGDM